MRHARGWASVVRNAFALQARVTLPLEPRPSPTAQGPYA